MVKIQVYSRKEIFMEKVMKVIGYVGACLIAPMVIFVIILNRLVRIIGANLAFVVYANAPEVSNMTLDLAMRIASLFDLINIEYDLGEYHIG